MQEEEIWLMIESIKQLREARGLTQEELAEKAKISWSHLAKVEAHIRVMSMKTYLELLKAMNVSVEEHFQYLKMKAENPLLVNKVLRLLQDCDDEEIALLLGSMEGAKKGIREYKKHFMPENDT